MVNNINVEVFKKLMSEDDLHGIINQNVKTKYKILESTLRPASENSLLGFLGDHFKAEIVVQLENGETHTIHLFIKSKPLENIIKADFVDNLNVFKKESTVFNGPMKEFNCNEEFGLWRPIVYLATSKIIVMRDHSYDGFKQIEEIKYMDYDYCVVALYAIAKFHSASINFELNHKNTTPLYKVVDQYKIIGSSSQYSDGPWLRAGIKSILKFLRVFSTKYNNKHTNFNKIKENLLQEVLDTCKLKIYDDQINVILHRDLWANNILFQQNNDGKVVNAMLIDYQLIGYGPATLDVMGFFYLNTDKEFRKIHAEALLKYYYEKLITNIQDSSYNATHTWETFLQSAEYSRKFGMTQAMILFPYILMDPMNAKIVFDNSDNFEYYSTVDRSEPMISYAKENLHYKNRILDVIEEFIERYLI